MRSIKRAIVAGSLTAILAGAGWTTTSAGVDLPESAADKAASVTAGVVTQQGPAQAESRFSTADTPAAAADFGQCVAEAAKNAAESGGQDWNPTQGCDHPSARSNAVSAPGLEIASEQANSHASDGLSKAESARGSRAPARRPAR